MIQESEDKQTVEFRTSTELSLVRKAKETFQECSTKDNEDERDSDTDDVKRTSLDFSSSNQTKSHFSRLLLNLQNIDNQLDSCISSYFMAMNNAIETHDEEIRNIVEHHYLQKRDKAIVNYRETLSILSSRHSQHVHTLKKQIQEAERIETEQEESDLRMHDQHCEEVRGKFMEDTNALCVVMEARKDELNMAIQQLVADFRISQDQKYEKLRKLKEGGEVQELAKVAREIEQTQAALRVNRLKMQQEEMELEEYVSKKSSNGAESMNLYCSLKNSLKTERLDLKSQTTQLSLSANKCRRTLAKDLEKVTNIIRIFDHCEMEERRQMISFNDEPCNAASDICRSNHENLVEMKVKALTMEVEKLEIELSENRRHCADLKNRYRKRHEWNTLQCDNVVTNARRGKPFLINGKQVN